MSRVAQWESLLSPCCGGLTYRDGDPPHSRTGRSHPPCLLRGAQWAVGAGWAELCGWGGGTHPRPSLLNRASCTTRSTWEGPVKGFACLEVSTSSPQFSVHLSLPWWLSGEDSPVVQETRVPSLGQQDPRRRKWQPTLVFLP